MLDIKDFYLPMGGSPDDSAPDFESPTLEAVCAAERQARIERGLEARPAPIPAHPDDDPGLVRMARERGAE